MTSRLTLRKAIGSTLAIAFCASVLPLSSPAVAQESDKNQQAEQCGAVHIVIAQGTGQSSTTMNNDVTDTFIEGKIATDMMKKFPGEVTSWQVNYPSSSGALYSTMGRNGETTTYGDSRLMGAKRVIEHITKYRLQCPGAKILITGFSQGASVAGDAASLISHGASSNTTADDIMGVILFADPGRSGNSQYTGTLGATAYIPLPEGARYQRNGEYVIPGNNQDTVGWTGQRSLPFADMEGRVLSLCSPFDLACTIEDGSVLRDIADITDKNWLPEPASYRDNATIMNMATSGKLAGVMTGLLGSSAAQDYLNGDVEGFFRDYHTLVEKDSYLGEDDKATLFNAETEMRYVFALLKSEKGYGPDATNKAILTHIFQQFGDKIAGYKAIPDGFKEPAKMLASVISSGDTSSIPEETKTRMAATVNYAIDFRENHGVYFRDQSNYKVDGKSAIKWVTSALEQGIQNVLDGTPYEVNPGVNPRDDQTPIEVSDPQRKDDGLRGIVDPNLNYLHLPRG